MKGEITKVHWLNSDHFLLSWHHPFPSTIYSKLKLHFLISIPSHSLSPLFSAALLCYWLCLSRVSADKHTGIAHFVVHTYILVHRVDLHSEYCGLLEWRELWRSVPWLLCFWFWVFSLLHLPAMIMVKLWARASSSTRLRDLGISLLTRESGGGDIPVSLTEKLMGYVTQIVPHFLLEIKWLWCIGILESVKRFYKLCRRWIVAGGSCWRVLWCRGQCEIWVAHGVHCYHVVLEHHRIRQANGCQWRA